MFWNELRQPWSIAIITAAVLLAALLLHDRYRTPPYEWPNHPEGIPADEFAFAEKNGIEWQTLDMPALLSVEVARMSQQPLDGVLPSQSICEGEDCRSPMELTASAIADLRRLREYNGDALRLIYMVSRSGEGAGMRVNPGPMDEQVLRHNVAGMAEPVVYCDLLLHTVEGDPRGALRAMNAIYRICEAVSVFPTGAHQESRAAILKRAHQTVPVLANRLRLKPRHWRELHAMAVRAAEGFEQNMRDSIEFEASLALLPYVRQDDDSYRQPWSIRPWRRPPIEDPLVALRFVYSALTGHEHAARMGIVRFARENRRSYDTREHILDTNERHGLRVPSDGGIEHSFYLAHQHLAWAVAFPGLIRVAAAVDCHRQTHGAFPESLQAIGPDCLPNDIETLFQDPLGTSGEDDPRYRFRHTPRGVLIYSLGRDRYDDTAHIHNVTAMVNPDGHGRRVLYGTEGDDIGFELLTDLPKDEVAP